MISAPTSEQQLQQYAEQLAGSTLGTIANDLQLPVPKHLHRQKGWVGQLLEQALGATAASKAAPDFELINVELKTIPLNHKQQPKESTFVCSATPPFAIDWQQSLVWKKMRRVLWVPIEAESSIAIADRRVGYAFLWSPTTDQANILQQDWLELTDMLSLGNYAQLTAKHGTYLQCRPKAAHSRIVRNDIDSEGHLQKIIPRGFYLRTCFTQQLLQS